MRMRVWLFTNVAEVLECIAGIAMVNLATPYQQSEVVKFAEDGETGLVDGQNDGSTTTGHPDGVGERWRWG